MLESLSKKPILLLGPRQIEADFVVGDKVAIEVKASQRVTSKDEKGLLALNEEVALERKIIVCNESEQRVSDSGVEIYPVEDFLRSLWKGNFQ